MKKRITASCLTFSFIAQPVFAEDISRYMCESTEAIGRQSNKGMWSSTSFDKLQFVVDIKNTRFISVKFGDDQSAVCTGEKLGYVGENYGYHCDSPNTLFQFNPINLKYIYGHLGGYAVSDPVKSTPVSIEIGKCRKI